MQKRATKNRPKTEKPTKEKGEEKEDLSVFSCSDDIELGQQWERKSHVGGYNSAETAVILNEEIERHFFWLCVARAPVVSCLVKWEGQHLLSGAVCLAA